MIRIPPTDSIFLFSYFLITSITINALFLGLFHISIEWWISRIENLTNFSFEFVFSYARRKRIKILRDAEHSIICRDFYHIAKNKSGWTFWWIFCIILELSKSKDELSRPFLIIGLMLWLGFSVVLRVGGGGGEGCESVGVGFFRDTWEYMRSFTEYIMYPYWRTSHISCYCIKYLSIHLSLKRSLFFVLSLIIKQRYSLYLYFINQNILFLFILY